MYRTKRTRITAETREITRVRQVPRPLTAAFCTRCQEEIFWLDVERTIKKTGLSAREIFRLVEDDRLHFRETPNGNLLICPNSLFSAF